jgi:LysR family hydrogen peroxide-inducible transcriptional activator
MTIVQLKYAITLERVKNYAQAATELLITQPTLSMQIQKLERYLGFEIFDRTRNPLGTTISGKEFLVQAKKVLEEFEKLEYSFRSSPDQMEGELKIGIIPTIASYLLVKLLPSLSQKYPNLSVRIFETATEQIIKKLETGELDLGILATPLKSKKILEYPIYYEPFNLYVSPNYNSKENPISIEKLKDYPILILGEEHCFREQTLKICTSLSKSTIETGSFSTIKKLVDNNMGITLLPEFEEVEDVKRKRILQNPVPAREISIVSNPSFYKHSLMKAVQKDIASIIPKKYHSRGNLHIIGVID